MAAEKKYLYKSGWHWYPNTSHWSRLFCCADLFVRSIKWLLIRAFAWTNSWLLLRIDAGSILRVASPVMWLCPPLLTISCFYKSITAFSCRLYCAEHLLSDWHSFCRVRAVRPNNVNYCCFDLSPLLLCFIKSICLAQLKLNQLSPVYVDIKLDHIEGFTRTLATFIWNESQIGIVASTNYSVCCSK